MSFEHDVGFWRTFGRVPEDGVVVGEEGEEDPEAECGCWELDSAGAGDERVNCEMRRTAEDHEGCKGCRAMASPGHSWKS